jgi:hypothetical protein
VCRAAVCFPKAYLRRRYTMRATGTSNHSSAPPEGAPPKPVCDMLHPSVSTELGVSPGGVGLGKGSVAVAVGVGVAGAVGVAVFVGVRVNVGVLVGVGVSGGGGVGVSVGSGVGVSVGVGVSLGAGVGAGAQMPSTQTRSGGVGQGSSTLQGTMVQAPGGFTQMPSGQSASVVHPGNAWQVPTSSVMTHTESSGQSVCSVQLFGEHT